METEIWNIQHWFKDSKQLSYVLWYSFLLFCLHNLCSALYILLINEVK